MLYLNTDESLEDLKDMLRIDTDADDNLLKNYLTTSEIMLQKAVGKDDSVFYLKDEVKTLYKTACYALTGTLYTYRVSVADHAQYPVNSTYNSIVGVLRGMYLDVKDGDSNA